MIDTDDASHFAYTRFDIVETYPEHVQVFFQTNDDGDTGYPGEWAEDVLVYEGPDALEKAKRHCGVSRQGVGQRVFVTLNGKEI